MEGGRLSISRPIRYSFTLATLLAFMVAISAVYVPKAASEPEDKRSCQDVVCDKRIDRDPPEQNGPERPVDSQGMPGRSLTRSVDYWVNACSGNEPSADRPFGGTLECAAYRSCSMPGYVHVWLYRRTLSNGHWTLPDRLSDGCLDVADDPQRAGTVSEAMVIEELRAHALPRLQLIPQPGKDDLILGLDTNVYTKATKQTGSLWFFDRTLRVEFETTPDEFRWTFGDGATTQTTEPGRPYPTRDITHTYEHTGEYSARVDVTWGHVRFRLPGGAWQASNQRPVTRGIPVTLTVGELHAELGATSSVR